MYNHMHARGLHTYIHAYKYTYDELLELDEELLELELDEDELEELECDEELDDDDVLELDDDDDEELLLLLLLLEELEDDDELLQLLDDDDDLLELHTCMYSGVCVCLYVHTQRPCTPQDARFCSLTICICMHWHLRIYL
jgi:hypothetical protein